MNKNVPVFTTKYAIENEALITNVVHDSEGDWQFFTKEDDTTNESARIVSLEEILTLDPSIEAILWIPEGTKAWRSDKDSEWTTGI